MVDLSIFTAGTGAGCVRSPVNGDRTGPRAAPSWRQPLTAASPRSAASSAATDSAEVRGRAARRFPARAVPAHAPVPPAPPLRQPSAPPLPLSPPRVARHGHLADDHAWIRAPRPFLVQSMRIDARSGERLVNLTTDPVQPTRGACGDPRTDTERRSARGQRRAVRGAHGSRQSGGVGTLRADPPCGVRGRPGRAAYPPERGLTARRIRRHRIRMANPAAPNPRGGFAAAGTGDPPLPGNKRTSGPSPGCSPRCPFARWSIRTPGGCGNRPPGEAARSAPQHGRRTGQLYGLPAPRLPPGPARGGRRGVAARPLAGPGHPVRRAAARPASTGAPRAGTGRRLLRAQGALTPGRFQAAPSGRRPVLHGDDGHRTPGAPSPTPATIRPFSTTRRAGRALLRGCHPVGRPRPRDRCVKGRAPRRGDWQLAAVGEAAALGRGLLSQAEQADQDPSRPT